MDKLKVMIADDHAFMRLGLKTYIDSQRDMTVVGEAENGERAVAEAKRLKPDVVIMDLMMPVLNGAEATAAIRRELPGTKVLILTSYGNSDALVRAVAAGATGAQPKEAPTKDILTAVRTLGAGGVVIAPEFRAFLDEGALPELTDRQLTILEGMVRGLTNREIGELCGIAAESVKKHVSVILTKLGAATRAEASAIAIRRNLIRT